jgi:predicted DNA-binding antitoxin AbrB/MazE fold protein
MHRVIQAVYENGVLRPLEPVTFAENEHVQLLVEDEQAYEAYLVELLGGREAYEAAKHETITHEEVRKALSKDTSSWADTVRQMRDEGY